MNWFNQELFFGEQNQAKVCQESQPGTELLRNFTWLFRNSWQIPEPGSGISDKFFNLGLVQEF